MAGQLQAHRGRNVPDAAVILKIMENGVHIRSHYSSLTTRTYKITNPTYMRRDNN
jgi:hypothetical protein